jgi:hypothetical protein
MSSHIMIQLVDERIESVFSIHIFVFLRLLLYKNLPKSPTNKCGAFGQHLKGSTLFDNDRDGLF